MSPRVVRRMSLVALLAATTAAGVVAKQDDPIKFRLRTAREAYDAEMDRARKEAADYFAQREDAARKEGNKKLVDQIKAERLAFDAKGELPKGFPQSIKDKGAAARAKMEKAYEEAVKDFTKEKKDAEAAAVEKELAAFKANQPIRVAREKALESKDGAKLFGAEAWKQVQPVAERLLKEKGTDFLIETYEKPPKGTPEKVRAMSKDEKEKFFHEIVTERVKAEKLHGVYIIVTKTPSYMYVGTTGDADFPSGHGSRIREALLSALRNRKFDDGLAKVLNLALEAKGLEEKK